MAHKRMRCDHAEERAEHDATPPTPRTEGDDHDSQEMMKLEVRVEGPDRTIEKTFLLRVWAFDRISAVKTAIQDKEGIPADMQRLYKGDRELQDHLTVLFSDVFDGDVIFCSTAAPAPTSRTFKIFVFDVTREKLVTVEVKPRMTMAAVKMKISSEQGWDLTGRKVLDQNYLILADDSTVASHGLDRPGATIQLHPLGCANCDRMLAKLQTR
jgi:hypothetical protein